MSVLSEELPAPVWSRDFPPPAILAVAGITVFALCSMVVLAVDLVTIGRIDAGQAMTAAEYAETNEATTGVAALGAVVAYVTGAPWFHRALRIRRELLNRGGSHPLWGWFGWIIPLLNLVIPLVLIGRLWTGLGRRPFGLGAVPVLVGGAWLVMGLTGALGSPADDVTIDVGAAQRGVVYDVACLVFAAALATFVVLVTRGQRRVIAERALGGTGYPMAPSGA